MATRKRYNLMYPRTFSDGADGAVKNRKEFLKVGVAWQLPNRDGFTIQLYLAMPKDTELVALAVEPKDESSEASKGKAASRGRR